MKKILKLEPPPITAFSHQCTLYAILAAHDEAEAWVQSNFIQIYALKNLYNTARNGTLDFFYHYYGDFRFTEYFANPWLLTCRYPRQVVKDRWDSLILFLKERIDQNEYVYMVLDRKEYRHRKKSSFHPTLIYGYDDVEQVLYTADNDLTGKYSVETIAYTYINAMDLMIPYLEDAQYGRCEGIMSLKVRKIPGLLLDDAVEPTFQIEKIIIDLSDYIKPHIQSNLYSFGIDCYDELIKYYQEVHRHRDNKSDKRSISSLIDHKYLMIKRLSYLYLHHYVDHDYSDAVKLLHKGLVTIRNNILKYNGLTDLDKELPIKYIVSKLNEIKVCEVEIIQKVLEETATRF